MIRFIAIGCLALGFFALAPSESEARLFKGRARFEPSCCTGRQPVCKVMRAAVNVTLAPVRFVNEVRPRLCTRSGCH
jgi:hypothetical protein